MWAPIACLLWAGAVIVLPKGTTCPSGEAIAAELDRLDAAAALAALGSPEITIKDTKMHVVLRGPDGSILGTREIAAPEACHERATVAAVFIAAWVGEWTTAPMIEDQDTKRAASNPTAPARPRAKAADSTSRASLVSRDRGEVEKADKNPQVPRLTNLREQGEVAQADAAKLPEAKVASSAAKVESAPPAIPPDDAKAAPSGTRAQPEAAGETKAVAAKQARRGPRGEIAGLGFGTHDGDAGTFGAGILVGYRPTGALALAAVFEATGERERTLGPGLAGYRSFRLGVGAGVQRNWGRVFGDIGLFPELTLLTLNGKQLATGRSATAWGAAADLRARLGIAWGRVAPFLFAGVSYDLRQESLTLDDRPQTILTLSRWNVSAGAGLAFLFGTR
jgi:hypothetical protein